MNWLNRNIKSILFLFSTYLLILAFRGFQFASGDVVDVMSYAKYIQDNSLFLQDFYITNIRAVIPNERLMYVSLIALMGENIYWMPFFIHLLITLIFLIGVYKIASKYIKSVSLRWILILILFGPLYKFNLGGNELYYNMLISSYVAKVIGVWALLYYIKSKKIISYLLIIFSTFLHPTVGAQLFIIFFLVDILSIIQKKSYYRLKMIYPGIVLYLLFAGTYIYLLLSSVNKSGVNDMMFFEIFEFRNAHHFFPQYYPLKSYFIEIFLFVLGVFAMIKLKFNTLFKISIIIILGLVVYVFGVLFLKLPIILSTQWFKSTIWFEFISLIAIVAYIDSKFPFFKNTIFRKYTLILVVSINIIVWILIFNSFSYFEQKSYSLIDGMNLTLEEDIGIKVKNKISKDAVFIYPMEFTGFKYYSERSAYIDFKSVVHRRDALGEWYNRINEVYGIDINTRRLGKDLFEEGKINYSRISKNKLTELKFKGVDYIVQYTNEKLDLPLVVENEKYRVYEIK